MTTKKEKKLDRSKLAKGPLTESEYREVVYLPQTKGVVNPPKERSEPGQWHGNVWHADRVEDPSLVGMLQNYNHLSGGERFKLLQRISENLTVGNGEVLFEPDRKLFKAIAEARDKWLYPGRFPLNEIVAEARVQILKVNENGEPIGSSTDTYYKNQDRVERLQRGLVDTRSDIVIDRKRRMRRFLGL